MANNGRPKATMHGKARVTQTVTPPIFLLFQMIPDIWTIVRLFGVLAIASTVDYPILYIPITLSSLALDVMDYFLLLEVGHVPPFSFGNGISTKIASVVTVTHLATIAASNFEEYGALSAVLLRCYLAADVLVAAIEARPKPGREATDNFVLQFGYHDNTVEWSKWTPGFSMLTWILLYAGHYYPDVVPLPLPWAPTMGNIFLAIAPFTAVATVVQFAGNIIRANMLLVLAENPGMTLTKPKRKVEPAELNAVAASDDVELGDIRSVQRAALRARKQQQQQAGKRGAAGADKEA